MIQNYRKFVTSAVAFTFVVVGITGVILKLLFKNHPLEEIHGWLGLALVAAAIPHVVQNWPSLRNHFRDWRVFLLLVPIVLVMAVFARGQQAEGGRLNPRAAFHKLAQGHANDVARAFGKNPDAVLASMKGDGLHVDRGDQTIEQLARENQKPPEEILAYFAN